MSKLIKKTALVGGGVIGGGWARETGIERS